MKLSLLKIPVQNVDRSVPFYEKGLGLQLEFAMAEYGWAQFMVGEIPFALYVPGMGGGNRQPGGSVDFHLQVEDIKALEARLKDFDPSLETGIFTNDDGSETLEFKDPDGNEWKIS